MKKNFWNKLKKPILALAPMYNVTDIAFRQMIVRLGKPDVIFTEFTSADGLSNRKSRKKLIDLHLKYRRNERPIVAQIFGTDPKTIFAAAKIVKRLKFDGLDINMGCPDRKVVKSGQGAALINNPKLAQKIIEAAKEGFGGPVSVKTRIGYNKNEVERWVSNLVEAMPDAIIMHGRTKKDMSKVPADWGAISVGGRIAKEAGITYIGNGDVKTYEEAIEKYNKYNVDGIMIGRGVLSNLMIFKRGANFENLSLDERIKLLKKHAIIYNKYFEGKKPFDVFKKHIRNYIFGFDRASEMRNYLMEAKNFSEFISKLKILNIYEKNKSTS